MVVLEIGFVCRTFVPTIFATVIRNLKNYRNSIVCCTTVKNINCSQKLQVLNANCVSTNYEQLSSLSHL